MSQALAWSCGRAFIETVTRPSDTDAPVRPAASGALLLRVLVAMSLVVAALLLVVGTPRDVGTPRHVGMASDVGAPASDDRSGLTQVHSVAAHAAVATSDAVRASASAVAPAAADLDGWAEEPLPSDPVPDVLPPLSASGFRPHGRTVVRAWESAPPDRPPRRV